MLRLITIVGTLVLAASIAVTASLTYGVEVQERVVDPAGDMGLASGYKPAERRIADILSSSIHREGRRLIFDAQVYSPLPPGLSDGFLNLTWKIRAKEGRWDVTASLFAAPDASLLNQKTRSGSSFSAGGFPGTVEMSGRRVRISLDTAQISGFPERFRWALFSRLNLQAGRQGVGIITDNAPDGRYANFRL